VSKPKTPDMPGDRFAIRPNGQVGWWVDADDCETQCKCDRKLWDTRAEAEDKLSTDDVLIRVRRVPSARMRAALRVVEAARANHHVNTGAGWLAVDDALAAFDATPGAGEGGTR
jgi:hypothetical protein